MMLELAMSTWVSLRSLAIVRERSGGNAYPETVSSSSKQADEGRITAPECDHKSTTAVSIIGDVVTCTKRIGNGKLTLAMRK